MSTPPIPPSPAEDAPHWNLIGSSPAVRGAIRALAQQLDTDPRVAVTAPDFGGWGVPDTYWDIGQILEREPPFDALRAAFAILNLGIADLPLAAYRRIWDDLQGLGQQRNTSQGLRRMVTAVLGPDDPYTDEIQFLEGAFGNPRSGMVYVLKNDTANAWGAAQRQSLLDLLRWEVPDWQGRYWKMWYAGAYTDLDISSYGREFAYLKIEPGV